MIDEITKNVTNATHILSNLGLVLLLMLMFHFIGYHAYFTAYALYQLPFLIMGFILGSLCRKLYNYYK